MEYGSTKTRANENSFIHRHIGPKKEDVAKMLNDLGHDDLDSFIDNVVPSSIRLTSPLEIAPGKNEYEYSNKINRIAAKNRVFKSYIGMGYYNTLTPSVIKRNILENPGWYTSYTPYQAEISQGRLEALINFQTTITELTAMPIANASLLDEATAAAEAMIMLYNSRSRQQVKNNVCKFFVDEDIFPQTKDVVNTRAKALGVEIITGPYNENGWIEDCFGLLVQYPNGEGEIKFYDELVLRAHEKECKVAVAADLLSLTLLRPPGEWGADVVVGSSQRFGIPLWYGGPHAGFFATKEEYKRFIPGRIIGESKDRFGNKAYRMALQTREQHIRRERATSNICTAQALLAIMSGMYAISHGPEGLKSIALRCHNFAHSLSNSLENLGYNQILKNYFDTIRVQLPHPITQDDIRIHALEREINLRYFENGDIGISIDETTNIDRLNRLIEVFAATMGKYFVNIIEVDYKTYFEARFLRKGEYMGQDIFSKYRSETELMRYMKTLENKDISLTRSMISLGSCTMKLNSAIELFSLGWPEFTELHPFVPVDQTEGYQQLFHELGKMLQKITGFSGISFQPNSGAAGEYSGLMVIKKYLESISQDYRNIVLIPASAHGTNPASAVMAGFKVNVVKCDSNGNIDIEDLKLKAVENKDSLAAFMVTYPSTHGVFEEKIVEMTEIVHENGGQVYMDGANMNAQVGLTSPAQIGADVCHLNLHKTFGIPHGGGGPGAGPICVAEHLIEFLPTHPVIQEGGINGIGAVSAAPYGSASILTISHAYCSLLGTEGLAYASKIAILNANYIAAKLQSYYNVLYKGESGYVAHEMIIDCRQFKQTYGITETDIAKRLMDYGYHAPTLSFPVSGTLMIEPTESESKEEIDRFIETFISIFNEIKCINEENQTDNVLKNAPHTQRKIIDDIWEHKYTRKEAALPINWIIDNKYWPPVARIDDAFGDRNLICSCT